MARQLEKLHSVLERLTDEAAEWINVYIEGYDWMPQIMFSCDTLHLAAELFGAEPTRVLYDDEDEGADDEDDEDADDEDDVPRSIGRDEFFVDGVRLFELVKGKEVSA